MMVFGASNDPQPIEGQEKERDNQENSDSSEPNETLVQFIRQIEADLVMQQHLIDVFRRMWAIPGSREIYDNGILSKSGGIDGNSAQIQVEKLTKQFIHCILSDSASYFKSKLTVVYVKNDSPTRAQLWLELIGMGRLTQEFLIITGDFNNVLSSRDRLGSPVLPGETQDFQNCIDTSEITALKATGYVKVDYLGAGISIHSPILIQVCPPPYSNPKPFKLFKTMLNHPDFGRLVDESWQKRT
ncbi:hypothetical protein KY290_025041 [Solanum tuberosum]|uniref:Uncharacterized protein n=1 Tax=Solanum tuberosum TaxID=4113 RepID=A0ABQ7USE7_SOLTU|nr:hypothetical protein KY290_025041 [Solanum tuberosum]